MLLLLPILAPVAGGIFVLRQKKESVRNRLVLALMLVTAGLVCAVCLTPEQTVELLTIQGRLHLALRSDLLAKFFLVLITCIWAPITLFAFPYIRHEGRDRQFFGFYTMTLGILAGLAMAKNFVTLYMFFEMMSLITVPLVLHSGTAASRRAGFQYLGYSVFGAGMALAGYFFVAYYMATPDFIHGGAIDPVKAAEHRPMLLVVYFLMIVGFGCKAGMMPMQAWLPAAHPVAPAPASAVLSGVITKTGIYGVLVLSTTVFLHDKQWGMLLAVLGAVTGGVAITGLSEETLQGDAAILEILRRCGARFTRTGQGVVFEKAPLHGTDIDLADCPDLGPVLMVLGLLCEGTTVIRNAERLRIKESDRIEAMETELRACGGQLESEGGTITIHGGAGALHAPEQPLSGHNDHRVVMSLAVLALATGLALPISGAEAIAKSWPDFLEAIKPLGAEVEHVG